MVEAALGLSAATPSRIVRTPIEPVVLARGWLPHVVEKEADGRERFANFIVPTLEDPFEIWNVLYTDEGIRRRYIGLFRGARDFMIVVRENLDGSLFWNAMQAKPKAMNGHRLGHLVFGR